MAEVLSESVLDQNGPNDHFGKNYLIPNWIFAFARPKWTISERSYRLGVRFDS